MTSPDKRGFFYLSLFSTIVDFSDIVAVLNKSEFNIHIFAIAESHTTPLIFDSGEYCSNSK